MAVGACVYHFPTLVPPATRAPSSGRSRRREVMTDRPRHAGVLPCSVPKERHQTSKASSISEGAKSGPSARPKRSNPCSTHNSVAFSCMIMLLRWSCADHTACMACLAACSVGAGGPKLTTRCCFFMLFVRTGDVSPTFDGRSGCENIHAGPHMSHGKRKTSLSSQLFAATARPYTTLLCSVLQHARLPRPVPRTLPF